MTKTDEEWVHIPKKVFEDELEQARQDAERKVIDLFDTEIKRFFIKKPVDEPVFFNEINHFIEIVEKKLTEVKGNEQKKKSL